jgi:acyl dehydratase
MVDNPPSSLPQIGDEIGPLLRTPTTEAVRQFVGLNTVEGPQRFLDAAAAGREGLQGPIVPGAMSLTYLGQLLQAWAPEARITLLDVIYRGWVHHNETLHVQGVVIDVTEEGEELLVECDVFVETPAGERPVAGKAVLRFPRP